MASFGAVVAHRQSFNILGLFRRGGQLEPGMHVLAGGTLWTEASEVVHTEHTAHMSMSAVGTMATETSVIPAKLCCKQFGMLSKCHINSRY